MRSDVSIILHTEEVSSASFVDILLFLSVEIELASVVAAVASFGVSLEGSGVVATDFVDTGAERSGTVVVASDDVRISLETALEIRSNGSYEDEEQVFVNGLFW